MSSEAELERTMWSTEVLGVGEVLASAAELSRKKRSGGEEIEPPLLTLILRGGARLDGYVLDMKGDGCGGRLIALWPEGARRDRRDSVAYLAMSEVQAVVLREKGRFERFREAVASAEPLSSLQLKRRIAELGGRLAEILGEGAGIEIVRDDFEDSNESRGPIARAAEMIVEALDAAAVDDFSRETIRKAIGGITIGKVHGRALVIENGTLLADPAQMVGVSKNALQRMLNDLF